MKHITITYSVAIRLICLLVTLADGSSWISAQENILPVKKISKPVKNTFESILIIDNQTVMVPVKRTFEMDIMHRFGTVENGYKDFYGFFAPSNIRLGFNYTPVNNLLVGVAVTKSDMTWEGYAKYAIIRQTNNKYPVSISFYANAAVDTREKDNFIYSSDRLSYFNQLIIARKITDKLSLEVAPSLSHINVVEGYYKSPGVLAGVMKHDHIAIAFSGRYKVRPAMAIIANYDQPLTKHTTNNPMPNLSLGLELASSGHTFQFFIGNYSFMTPQRNNIFNQNDYKNRQFLIGFNITRLWNY